MHDKDRDSFGENNSMSDKFSSPFSFFLPTSWQGFATLLARLCHRHGKSLPKAWQ
jgi:hypothetical protein